MAISAVGGLLRFKGCGFKSHQGRIFWKRFLIPQIITIDIVINIGLWLRLFLADCCPATHIVTYFCIILIENFKYMCIRQFKS